MDRHAFESLEFAIRDLVPRPDLLERPAERDLKLHHVAQAQLRRKYKTFRSEATLSAVLSGNGRTITVNGRLDGYRRTGKGITLYEIKSVPGDPRRWLKSPLLQNARWQLQLYADLARHSQNKPWGRGEPVEAALCLISETHRQALEPVDINESAGILTSRLNILLRDIRPWRSYVDVTLRKLEAFVIEDQRSDRPEQSDAWRQLSHDVSESHVLLSMPPGSGKTRVAVRYALRAALTAGRRVVWITIKARGRDEILQECDRYRQAGVPLRVLWKTSRQRLCDCASPGSSCQRGIDTRNSLFLEPLIGLDDSPSWSPEELASYASKHELCPFELANAIEHRADMIIADVNYLLNPSSLSARDSIVVLDEVQNLSRRVYENSQIRIPREDLVEVTALLAHPARQQVRRMLSDRSEEESGGSFLRDGVVSLRDQTSDFDGRNPVISNIRRAARFCEEFADDYHLAWFRGSTTPVLIGTLANARSTLARLVDSQNSIRALSGSLPADSVSRRAIFRLADHLKIAEVQPASPHPVYIVPKLSFKFPLTAEDHQMATDMLLELRECFPATIAVFGQNRASNEFLSMRLRVRNQTVMLDEDLADDWESAVAARPDFLFIAIGGSLSEGVNPPPDLFSCGAILSPAFRAPDEFDLLRSSIRRQNTDSLGDDSAGSDNIERRAEAVSRIIQAAGRLQRSPAFAKPVFLLNRDFATPEFLRAWPHNWYQSSPETMIYPTVSSAMDHLKAAKHATS